MANLTVSEFAEKLHFTVGLPKWHEMNILPQKKSF